MSRERIMRAGDFAMVRLPHQVLEDLGVDIGDEVEISVAEGSLIVRPLDEVQRAERIERARESVFERRQGAYDELAKGPD